MQIWIQVRSGEHEEYNKIEPVILNYLSHSVVDFLLLNVC